MAKKEKETKQKSSYFKDMRTELKKVVWPTPKELLNSTIAVLAFVLIFAVIVFVLDFCFDNLNKYVITGFQETVQSALSTETSEEEETDGTESTEDTETESTETEDTESESTETEETSTETGDEEVSTDGIETEEIEVESSSDTETTE